MDQLTKRAVAGQLERAPGHRMEQVVEALQHRDSRRIGGLGNPLRLLAIAGERLLGQHGLAGGDGSQIPWRMKRVRQRVVDDVYLGIADHVGIRRQNPFHAVFLSEVLGALRIPRGDRDQPVPQVLAGPTMASSAIRDAPRTPIRRVMPERRGIRHS